MSRDRAGQQTATQVMQGRQRSRGQGGAALLRQAMRNPRALGRALVVGEAVGEAVARSPRPGYPGPRGAR